MKKRLFLIYLPAIFFLAVPVFIFLNFKSYSGITAKSALSRNSARVGDAVRYEVTAVAGKNTYVDIPDVKSGLSAFEVIDDGLSRKDFLWRQKITRWYVLTQYASGEYIIPKVTVKYRKEDGDTGSVETGEARIAIKSVLGDNAVSDFKPRLGGGISSRGMKTVKAPEAPSRDIDVPIRLKIAEAGGPFNIITYSDIGIICASAAGVIVMILFMLRSLKKRVQKVPILSSYEIAINKLDKLESAGLQMEGAVKEAYSGMASALKCFIISTHNMASAELTTKEFLREIYKTENIDKTWKPDIEKLLSLCDLVKFSGYMPAAGELKSSFESARKIIGAVHAADRPKEVRL